MKTWIKTSIAAAVLASTVIGANALARGGDCDGARGNGPSAWQEMSPEKMKARIAQRGEVQAARLELALALTKDQMPAWNELKTELKARDDRMVANMEARRSAEVPKTVLERMDRAAEMSKTRQTEMASMRKAVERFYGQLSDAQKTVFDAEFAQLGCRHGRGERGLGWDGRRMGPGNGMHDGGGRWGDRS